MTPPDPAGGPKFRNLRDLAATYTEEAIETIRSIMHNSDDDWLRLACANALLDRGYGKPGEASIFEQQKALSTTCSTTYATIAEFKAELNRRGLPIDRLEEPKLIDHKPIDK